MLKVLVSINLILLLGGCYKKKEPSFLEGIQDVTLDIPEKSWKGGGEKQNSVSNKKLNTTFKRVIPGLYQIKNAKGILFDKHYPVNTNEKVFLVTIRKERLG